MAQYARPNSDIDNEWEVWSPTPLYQQLDEEVANDSDKISATLDELDPSGAAIVGLSSLVDPGVDTGHILRFRARLASGVIDFSILRITDGSGFDLVTLSEPALTGSFQTFEYALSASDAALLDGYYTSDLGVLFDASVYLSGLPPTGNAEIEVSWIELEVPDTDPSPSDLEISTPISWREIGTTWTDNSDDEDHFDVERDGEKIDEVPADTESYTDDDTALQPTINPDDPAPSPETFCYIITAIAGDGSEIGSTAQVCGTPAQVVYNSQTIYCSPAASDYYEPLEEVDGLTYTEVGDEASPSYTGITGTTPTYIEVTGSTPSYTEVTS